jgi:hypothetical protein
VPEMGICVCLAPDRRLSNEDHVHNTELCARSGIPIRSVGIHSRRSARPFNEMAQASSAIIVAIKPLWNMSSYA